MKLRHHCNISRPVALHYLCRRAPWQSGLSTLIFSSLNRSSSHWCGSEHNSGHMWDKPTSVCRWSCVLFFLEDLPFLPVWVLPGRIPPKTDFLVILWPIRKSLANSVNQTSDVTRWISWRNRKPCNTVTSLNDSEIMAIIRHAKLIWKKGILAICCSKN